MLVAPWGVSGCLMSGRVRCIERNQLLVPFSGSWCLGSQVYPLVHVCLRTPGHLLDIMPRRLKNLPAGVTDSLPEH